MTRSVEIPAEAVRDAIAAFDDFEMRAMNAVEDQDAHFEDAMRVALAAALPYLAPAEETKSPDWGPDWDQAGYEAAVAKGMPRLPGDHVVAAPAGDGGLREALEELVDQWQYSDGKGFRGFYEDAQSLLAAHPAAPAVPQPAGKGDPVADWARLDESPAASAQMIQWHAPETASALTESAVPQPADRTRHAIWRAVYDSAIQPLQPSEIADKATDVVLALSAQPVDREALIQVIAEYIDDLDNVPAMGTPADHLERRAVHVADAVLAVLAGEQEQARTE